MYLLLLALFFGPFYLWKSGLPQASHIIAAAVLGQRYVLARPKQVYFEKAWGCQVLFVVYSFVVAAVIYYFYRDIATMMAPLYYLFGFLVFLEVVSLYAEQGKKFLNLVFWLHVLLMLVVLLLIALGVGRSYISGSAGLRVKAFFNNPNQLAGWTVWLVVVISAAGRALYRTWWPGVAALLVATILFYYSLSRAGFIALAVFLVFYFTLGLNRFVLWYKKHKNAVLKKWVLIVSIVLVLLLLMAFVLVMLQYFDYGTTGLNSLDRTIDRIVKTKADIARQIKIRGYDRLWKYPQYLVFGAGEGARERFAEKTSYTQYEVHSSWAGLLFNYGVVGFTLFAAFIFALLKRIKYIWFKLILLAPFFFGFTNYNIRNWYFWVGLGLVYCCALYLQETEGGKTSIKPLKLSRLVKDLFGQSWPFKKCFGQIKDAHGKV